MLFSRLGVLVSEIYKKIAPIITAIARTLKAIRYRLRPLIQGVATLLYSRESNSELTGDAAPIEIIEIETSDTSATVIGKIESSGLQSAFIELPENAYEFERLDH